jgi:hypothetical protein
MRIWLALLVAPLLALTDLAIAFATVSWACAHQATFAVHAVHFAFLLATLACTVGAWTAWRAGAATKGQTATQAHFLAGVGMAVATLSTVTVAGMWLPVSMIATCIS